MQHIIEPMDHTPDQVPDPIEIRFEVDPSRYKELDEIATENGCDVAEVVNSILDGAFKFLGQETISEGVRTDWDWTREWEEDEDHEPNQAA